MMLPLQSILLQALLLLSPIKEAEQIESKLDRDLAAAAQRIEAVYVSDRFSHVEYHANTSSHAATVSFPDYSSVPRAVLFGSCTQKNGILRRTGNGRHCGYIIPLDQGGRPLNLLSFDEVILEGDFSGTWELAFADTLNALREENVPVPRLGSPAEFRFDFSKVRALSDTRQARHLVLLLTSSSGSASIRRVHFTHTARPGYRENSGIWIWRRDKIIGHENDVVEQLKSLLIQRVYIQVGDDPEVFRPFLLTAARQGIAVFALDGDPGYVFASAPLMSRIHRIEEYNRNNPDAAFAGFQTDIEPYLNRDFNIRKSEYISEYIALMKRIRKASALPLSVVIPFWFDGLTADGKSLTQHVMEIADEVVVMSYRTDPAALLEISRNTLALGEQYRKPVRLGVELGNIPDEHHVELTKCTTLTPGAFMLGGFWWKKTAEYDSYGSRISFRNMMPSLPGFLSTKIPFSSFGGWVLHSYEELK